METEHLRHSDNRDGGDVVVGLLDVLSFNWYSEVEQLTREEELLVLVEDEVTHVLVEVGEHYSAIPVICYTTSIHGFSDQITKCFPRQVFVF